MVVAALGVVLWIIIVACSIAALVCAILVWIKMFQNDQTGLGIACIVLTVVCGVGGIITFIIGWMNAAKWGLKNVMLLWTGSVVGSLVCYLLLVVVVFAAVAANPQLQNIDFQNIPME